MGDDKQTVLIVVGNPMTEASLRSHFERRGWQATVCDDGDKAVDEYVASKPDLVLLSPVSYTHLTLPTIRSV